MKWLALFVVVLCLFTIGCSAAQHAETEARIADLQSRIDKIIQDVKDGNINISEGLELVEALKSAKQALEVNKEDIGWKDIIQTIISIAAATGLVRAQRGPSSKAFKSELHSLAEKVTA